MSRLSPIILATILSAFAGPALAQDTKENSEFKLAVNLYNSGMYDLAVDQFQNFINAYSGTANSIEARFYLGLTQMKLQRQEEARITFQNFALTYPENPKAPEAWTRVGDAYAAMNNDREAASAYERVKVFHPNSPIAPEALLKSGTFYRKAGAKENARKAYRTIVQDYPSSSSVPSARLGLGELFLEDGRTEMAQAEFSRVMETASDPAIKAKATLLLGRVYLASGRDDDALMLFSRIVSGHKSTPSFPAAALEMGILLQSSGKYSEAVEQFKKAFADTLAEQLVRERALLEMGNSYAAKGDLANSLKQYERFLSFFPASELAPHVQLKAGLAAASAGNHRSALSYFRKVLSHKSPSGPDARSYETERKRALIAAAASAAVLRHYSDATELYRSYADQYASDPSSATVLMQLGNLRENTLKDYRRAINAYEDVLATHTRSTNVDDALCAIGRCREALNDVEGAIAAYTDLLEQYPSSDSAAAARNRMSFLRMYRAKNRDAGMEKLAALLGEVISTNSKSNLAFQLGEIYFNDLKDYRSAADQFGAAIDAGLDEARLADAHFFRVRSLHLLSEVEPSASGQAAGQYDAFLKRFPSGSRADDAALYNLKLRTKGKPDAEIITLCKDFLAARPKSPGRPDVLVILATAQGRAQRPRDALASLSRVTQEFPGSRFAEDAWLGMARLFMQMGSIDSAAHALTSSLKQFPRGTHAAECHWLLADLRMSQHRPAEAIALYRTLIDDFFYTTHAAQAEYRIGDALLEARAIDDAIPVFQSLWEREQTSPFISGADYKPLFQLANAYNRKGDRQRATQLFREYLQYDRKSPRAADAYLAMGVIARGQGNNESASAYFKQAASLSGSSGSRDIADLLFVTEQYAEAEKHYAQLARSATIDTHKQYFQSRVILSKLRMNDFKSAEPLISEFSKSYRRSDDLKAEIEYEKGLYYYRKQEYASARKAFENVTDDYDETPFAAWAEFYTGKILEATNKIPEAFKKYESLLKRFARSDVVPRIYLSLGNISYNAEKFQDAIGYYQRVVESPTTAGDILPYAMDNLIDAYNSVELYDAALKTTKDFIERFPNDQGIMDKRINIGVLYTRLKYYDQAIVHLQNLLNEAGSDVEAEIRYAIGEAHFYKGDYQQAILEFLKVPYLVTRKGIVDWTATSLYMAGQAYEKMSKFDQAMAMYQQIIDRPGIDGTFKAAAKKEIDRVKIVTKKSKK